VDGETEFLIPAKHLWSIFALLNHVGDDFMSSNNIPSRSLSSTLVRLCLPCFFAQSRGTITVLFTHCLAIRKVLTPVDNHNKGTNFWSIDAHVGKYACRVSTTETGHGGGVGRVVSRLE
jgi:hypothetical protein